MDGWQQRQMGRNDQNRHVANRRISPACGQNATIMNLRYRLRFFFQGREGFYNALATGTAVLLLIVLTISAWNAAWNAADKDARTRFEFLAAQSKNAIVERMAGYEQVLRGAAGLFSASISVERSEWKNYYQALKLDAYYPGIQGMGYAPFLAHPADVDFVARVRAEGFPDFAITPPGVREHYTPVLFLEPFGDRNLRAFGYDMYADPVRRAAMDQAVRTGGTTLSGKVTLAQETGIDNQAGFLMYKPVFREGPSSATLPGRHGVPQGFVYAVFRADDLINGILGKQRDIGISIYDGATLDRKALLYESRGIAGHQPMFSTTTSIVFHGHIWTLRLVSLPAFEATMERDEPRLVLLGGTVISLLLMTVLWSLWTTRMRAQRLARAMTREVRQRQAELEAMNNASPLGIFRTDAAGNFVYVNRMYESLCGMPASACMDMGWTNSLHPDDRERVTSGWEKTVNMQQPFATTNYRILRPDSNIIWVSAKAAPIYSDGSIVGYVGNIEDVTALRSKEEDLRVSREQLGLALEGSNLAIFDWDIPTKKVHLSDRWQEILGGERRPTETTMAELEALVHPEDIKKLQIKLYAALKGEARFYEVEHRVRNILGEWRWIQSRAKVSERDARGHALRITGTNADITESKEIERLKNEFISTVSHELRTPLTAIIGALGLMKEGSGKLTEESAMFLDMASQNSERLASLINDVLDLEKIESSQMRFHIEPVDIPQFLEKAMSLNAAYAVKLGVRFELHQPAPTVKVRVDGDRLMQVLTNLLSNAAKFSPKGATVAISAAVRKSSLRVSIRDSGPGIPLDFHDRIFQKFAQADSSDTRQKGGTGLGLSICKAIIEKMGGRIGFDSVPGEGATFYFELPTASDGESPRVTK